VIRLLVLCQERVIRRNFHQMAAGVPFGLQEAAFVDDVGLAGVVNVDVFYQVVEELSL
jgi:hypothetical protein